MDLLRNVVWAFNGVNYQNPEVFNEAISGYHLEAGIQQTPWDPEEIVLETPSVQIAYRYYVAPTDVKFDDEKFLDEDDADLEINDPGEENEQREVTATFMADNGYYFTALELMYKIHQRLWHRQLGDQIYFAGLLMCNIPERIAPPLFYLHCGN